MTAIIQAHGTLHPPMAIDNNANAIHLWQYKLRAKTGSSFACKLSRYEDLVYKAIGGDMCWSKFNKRSTHSLSDKQHFKSPK